MKKTLLFLLFLVNTIYSNEVTLKFSKLKIEDKPLFFKKLYDDKKLENLVFFEQQFRMINQNISNKIIKKKYIYCIGLISQIKNNHKEAINLFNQLLKDESYKVNESEELEILIALQESYFSLNIYSKVIYCNKRIDALIRKGVYYPLWSYNKYSRMYYRLKKYDKAIIRLKDEINFLYRNKKRDALIIPSAYNDLGFYYYLNRDYKNALYYFNYALKTAAVTLKYKNPISYYELYITIYSNISDIYIETNHFKKAEDIYHTHLEPNRVKINNQQILYFCDISYCKILLNLNKSDEFIRVLNSIYKYKNKIGNFNPLELLNLKLQFYKINKDWLNLVNIQDSIILFHKNQINKLEERNSSGSEMNYLIEQNEKKELINQNKIKEQEILIIGIILIAMTIGVIIVIIAIVNNNKKKNEIQKLNTSISESLSEKEILLQEIHHRVKNNLQIISGILELQKFNINDNIAKQALEEGRMRIKSIALVHQTMYQTKNFGSVNLNDFFRELINTIITTFATKNKLIKFDVKCEVERLNLNTIVPLSLIVNEIITNSFKHAFKEMNEGIIDFVIRKEAEYFCLELKDNGIGFPENMLKNKLQSMGIDLIEGLTKQLDGKVEFINENGAKTIVYFKNI